MEKWDRKILSIGTWQIRRELSYRSYNKLPKDIQKSLDEAELTPKRKHIASILIKRGLPLEKSIKYTTKCSHDTLSSLYKLKPCPLCIERDLKYIREEFKHQGFIPLSQYKRYKPKFAYIVTNIRIDGEIWIYPKRFTTRYDLLKKGYPYLYDVWGEFGLIGYTKIQYGTNK